jgi:hypothetical protein
MKNSKLYSISSLFILLIVQGCTSFNTKNDKSDLNITNRSDNELMTKDETQIEIYNSSQDTHHKNIKKDSKNELVSEIEREIQHLTMDLVAKLKKLNVNQSIVVMPVSLSSQMPSSFSEAREHIASLFINELFEFGFPVAVYQKEQKISDLTLESHISLYQGRYIINSYIKSTASGYIKSTAKATLSTNLLEQLEDGVKVLR